MMRSHVDLAMTLFERVRAELHCLYPKRHGIPSAMVSQAPLQEVSLLDLMERDPADVGAYVDEV